MGDREGEKGVSQQGSYVFMFIHEWHFRVATATATAPGLKFAAGSSKSDCASVQP